MQYQVITFYAFLPLEKETLPTLKQTLEQRAHELGIFGLTLIAPEGVNATMAGLPEQITTYKKFLSELFGDITWKESQSDLMPFKRFKVKIKEEIVQLKRPDIIPSGKESHLSPEEWDTLMAEDDVVIIDVRNWYETKLGTFKRAINPRTKKFSEFPQWLKESGIAKDKKIGIFCTGGIRCEKAALAMQEQGYGQVHQLDGGILTYIEKKPEKNFEGECFVFDSRCAVGQDLLPSTIYAVCAVCGNGGTLEGSCTHCGKTYRLCDDCQAAQTAALCSRNCRYQYARSA